MKSLVTDGVFHPSRLLLSYLRATSSLYTIPFSFWRGLFLNNSLQTHKVLLTPPYFRFITSQPPVDIGD